MYVITCKCRNRTTNNIATAFLINDSCIEYPYWSMTFDPGIAQFMSIDDLKAFWEKNKRFVRGRDPYNWIVKDDTIRASSVIITSESNLSY